MDGESEHLRSGDDLLESVVDGTSDKVNKQDEIRKFYSAKMSPPTYNLGKNQAI